MTILWDIFRWRYVHIQYPTPFCHLMNKCDFFSFNLRAHFQFAVKFWCWPKNEMHIRQLINECGGIDFDCTSMSPYSRWWNYTAVEKIIWQDRFKKGVLFCQRYILFYVDWQLCCNHQRELARLRHQSRVLWVPRN